MLFFYTDKQSYMEYELCNIIIFNNNIDISDNIQIFDIHTKQLITQKKIEKKDNTYQYNLKNINSGLYGITLDQEYFHPLIIKNSKTKNKVLFLFNTNTWQAYNVFEGKSYYRNYDYPDPKNNRRIPISVSFHRPFYNNFPNEICISDEIKKYLLENKIKINHSIILEIIFYSYLKSLHINFEVCCDRDLEDLNYIKKFKNIIICGHAEYWTFKMLDNLNAFHNVYNNNIINFAGNISYRLVVFKDNLLNKRSQIFNQRTPRFKILPHELFKVWYNGDGFNTYDHYVILEKEHPIFNNIDGQLIGKRISGYETDKVINKDLEKYILARGNNPISRQDKETKCKGGGNLIIIEDEHKKLISVGSVYFVSEVNECIELQTLIKNIFNYFGML